MIVDWINDVWSNQWCWINDRWSNYWWTKLFIGYRIYYHRSNQFYDQINLWSNQKWEIKLIISNWKSLINNHWWSNWWPMIQISDPPIISISWIDQMISRYVFDDPGLVLSISPGWRPQRRSSPWPCRSRQSSRTRPSHERWPGKVTKSRINKIITIYAICISNVSHSNWVINDIMLINTETVIKCL